MYIKKKDFFTPSGFIDAFTFVVEVTVVDSDSLTLPLVNSGAISYNFEVNYGDTNDIYTVTTWNDLDATYVYPTAGTYLIGIKGLCEGWAINNLTGRGRYRNIIQWGNVGFKKLNFYGALNLPATIAATDTIPGSTLTDLSTLFFGCTNLTTVPNINSWDTSNVTDMSSAFRSCKFNMSLSNWNTNIVTNMIFMFYFNNQFNGDIGTWNVSNVTNMASMFQSASAFNKAITNWNVSSCTNFSSMFLNATSYNQSMAGWVLKNSGTINCTSMFNNAANFNGTVTTWNTSFITNMSSMFRDSNLNQDLSAWDFSKTTTLSQFLYNAPFNQSPTSWNVGLTCTSLWLTFANTNLTSYDLTGWNISNVTNLESTFLNTSFNGNISTWNVSKVTTMNSTFNGSSFNGDISGWTPSGLLTNMQGTFGTTPFNRNISSWNVSNVTTFNQTFRNSSFSQDLSTWDISSTGDMTLFGTGANFTNTQYNNMLVAWEGLTTPPSNVIFGINAQYTETQGESGTTDGTAAFKLIDSTATFLTSGVAINDIVRGTAGYAKVTAIDSDTQLTLDVDTAVSGETYFIQTSNAAKARYSLFRTYNWTITDGGPI